MLRSFIRFPAFFTAASSFHLRACSTASSSAQFTTLLLDRPTPHIARVTLNRAAKSNAMDRKMWSEIASVFQALGSSEDKSRVVILCAAGKSFTSGIDLNDHGDMFSPKSGEDVSRRGWRMRDTINAYQASMSSLEECAKPVIASIHGACIGGGVDMVCAADIRIASSNAYFCIKEAELGLVADVGTLQRLPKVMGNDSLVRELAFTARRMHADEALARGFLSSVWTDRDALDKQALSLAERIASLSPIAVQGSKINLNYSRDHSTKSGLEFASAWNMGMLQTQDIPISIAAKMTKAEASYPDIK